MKSCANCRHSKMDGLIQALRCMRLNPATVEEEA